MKLKGEDDGISHKHNHNHPAIRRRDLLFANSPYNIQLTASWITCNSCRLRTLFENENEICVLALCDECEEGGREVR
jgi:hypothetical protein